MVKSNKVKETQWPTTEILEAHTMFTSDMLSMLSTWTSMPTGIAEPAKGQTLQWIRVKQQLEHILHESSVCTSARDYSCVNPTAELQCKT